MPGAGGDAAGEGCAGLLVSVAESKDRSCPLPSAHRVRGSPNAISHGSKRGSSLLLPQTRSGPAKVNPGTGRWDSTDGESRITHALGVVAD